MRLRGCTIALILIGLVGLFVVANVAPTMEDQYVATIQDTPVDFVIRASDEDIDPTDATAHPMRFVILEGPTHGVLLGDLTDVHYEGPHDATVEMTYVPADGYVGIDLVTIAVYDPFDETATGTTTIEIDVAAKRMIGLWSGSWNTEVGFDADADDITSIRTQLMEVYRIGQLMLQAIGGASVVTSGGISVSKLTPLQFNGSFAAGDFRLRSTVVFDPDKTAPDFFDYFRATAQYTLAGIGLSYQVFLDDVQTRSYQTITASSSLDGVSFSGMTRFNMDESCDYVYSQTSFNAAFEWCELDFRTIMLLTCEGFSSVSIGMYEYDLPILGFASPDFRIYADLVIRFETTAKTVSPSLELRTRWIDCVRVLGELVLGSSTEITGFSLYGFVIQQKVGDVTFRSATSGTASKNASVTGQVDYFEVLSLSGTTMSCCGVPGTWSISTYFQDDHPSILGWGMTRVYGSVGIGSSTRLTGGFIARTGGFGDPKFEFTFGWMTRW